MSAKVFIVFHPSFFKEIAVQEKYKPVQSCIGGHLERVKQITSSQFEIQITRLTMLYCSRKL